MEVSKVIPCLKKKQPWEKKRAKTNGSTEPWLCECKLCGSTSPPGRQPLSLTVLRCPQLPRSLLLHPQSRSPLGAAFGGGFFGGAAAFFAGIGAWAARAACGRPSSPSVPPGGTFSHRPAMLPSSSSSSSLPRDEGAGAGARGLRCCGDGCRGTDAAGVGPARRAASTSSAMDASDSRCVSDRLSSMAVRARSSAPAAHALTAAAASDWRWLGECAGAAAGLWCALGGIRAAAAAPEHAEEAPAESGDAPGATLSQRPAMPPASSKSSMCVLHLGLRGHAHTGERAMRASRRRARGG